MTNDLANAIVSIYHQGNADHYAGFDRIVVEQVVAPAVIPEPATMGALGLAVAGLGGYVRRRRRS